MTYRNCADGESLSCGCGCLSVCRNFGHRTLKTQHTINLIKFLKKSRIPILLVGGGGRRGACHACGSYNHHITECTKHRPDRYRDNKPRGRGQPRGDRGGRGREGGREYQARV
jgi:hypothetical protein